MPNFTLEQLKEKVIELAEQNPDFIYKAPDGASRCYYLLGENCSGCIFGQAIIALDPSMRDYLEQMDKINRSIDWIVKDLFDCIPENIINWCLYLQSRQDHGMSWGNAVEKVNESVEQV